MASSLLKASFSFSLLPSNPQHRTAQHRSRDCYCSLAQTLHYVRWESPECCLLMEEKGRRMTTVLKDRIVWMAKHPEKWVCRRERVLLQMLADTALVVTA